ncbi:myo-inositol-1(or 4)-monophosphatase [Inquilinus ginsengisoli]|uniref:Inositol-1-monophosphatase n=1 Tax=Inquilinus ginsengisoli TaxID=363840 RepID=A0ABU1JL72_9PROT|nr:inositol monophosphatase [Inquilinus ginsengisoli]MDR6288285.1 myo-inositol-1(or 4)-monophosphatase [Inquilinus ginsengisoli]
MSDQQTLALMRIVAEALARAGGQLARAHLAGHKALEIESKGPQDFVTVVDKAVETLIRGRLQEIFPDHAVLGEEFGLDRQGARIVWGLDPIDGTANFLRDRPVWCVSIGATIDGKPALGVIYEPVRDELYSAVAGQGATRNGTPIKVNAAARPDSAMIGVGYSPGKHVEAHVRQIGHILAHGGEYRRLGSSAMSLAYVADGRFDGYAAAHTNAWDVMAGLVLVKEAGGVTDDFIESGVQSGPVTAAAPGVAALAQQLKALV